MEKKILMSLQAGSGSGVDNPILANLNVHNIYLSKKKKGSPPS